MEDDNRQAKAAIDAGVPLLTEEEVRRLMAQPVWTVREAAQFLRVGDKVIRKLADEGTVVVYRVGRWIRIPRERFLDDLGHGRIELAIDQPRIGGSCEQEARTSTV